MAEEYNLSPEEEQKEIAKQYRGLLRSMKMKATAKEKKSIRQAFEVAVDAHKDMRRKSGEPYIFHPIAVARIVGEEMGLGWRSIVCALLHDVVEDTEWTVEDIEQSFDTKTARIIDGLTKISGVFDLNSSIQAENFRKLLLTLTDDIRVILVKLADRLHNMRTMQFMPRHKQLKISSETMFLYAPLAHRMGLYAIKSELEDLSMKYTEQKLYKEIAKKLQSTKRSRSKYINEFINPIQELLDKKTYPVTVYGRPKSIFSIWNKMRTKHVTFEEVYDLFAIRIIHDVPRDLEKSVCWEIYSTITDVYRPNPDRLRDWISNPKTNGYEALHTTVMGPSGKWVEVQIRSKRMHEIAEKGVAAHWKYKEGSATESGVDRWLQSIQDLLSDPDSNALDFLNDFKRDLFNEEIFAFTPKGDLRRLPYGATALDFAYDIHSEVGNKCIGAKVNHKLVPISYKLQNGDQVEILTSKKQKPAEDWLKHVATGKANGSIKKALKEERRSIALDGKEMLQRKFKQQKIDFVESNLTLILMHLKYETQLDFYFNVAIKRQNLNFLKDFEVVAGKLQLPKEALTKMVTETIEKRKEEAPTSVKKNAELLIMDESADKIDYKFANCCNPIPGDDVVGFVSVSDGIKVHKTSCPNAVNLMSKYGHRIVKTRWNNKYELAFLTCLRVNGLDNVGVVSAISDVISRQMEINMRSMSLDSLDGIFEGEIMVYVNDVDQLDNLIDNLENLEGVLSVQRFDQEEDN